MYFINLPNLSDLLVIVLTLAGEGIGESWVGKVLIADSIYNYAQEHHLTVRQSCLARRPNRYSCWNEPDKLIAKTASLVTTTSAWNDCVRIARQLNAGTYRPYSRALYYYNPKLCKKPKHIKSMVFLLKEGDHVFYTETK